MTNTDYPPSDSSSPSTPRPTQWERRPDALQFAGYEIVRELGRGGMGVVYLARNRVLDRLEAVKVLSRPSSEDRFQQEVRALARLCHPNVVTVYAALAGGAGALAFAMEYLDGETLARLVRSRGALSPPLACAYARQAALGLQHAHERGITHRDVKPQNLMLCRPAGQDTIKVLDFGLGKLGAPPAGADTVTLDGQLLGTPGYAAPEQMQDARSVDARADVYGLGTTLRFLLTGVQPTRDRAPSDVASGWPAGLADVLNRMTATDPAERYQTPAEVAAALSPYTVPPPERPVDAPDAAVTRVSRRRVIWAWAAGIFAAALVAGVTAWWGGPPRPLPPPPPPASDPPPAAEPRFTPLFNGTDLSGWVVDGGPAGEWRVEDGALVTTGTRNGPQTWLLSEREFGDVRVRFEYQLEPGGNSGFVFRAVPGERPVLRPGGPPTPRPYHQQVELSDDEHREWAWLLTGQINGGSGKGAPTLPPISPARLRPPPKWNAAEVELVGQSLAMSVNGERVQAGDLNRLIALGGTYPALTRSRGRIGFQQFAKTARFRNVESLELPPGDR